MIQYTPNANTQTHTALPKRNKLSLIITESSISTVLETHIQNTNPGWKLISVDAVCKNIFQFQTHTAVSGIFVRNAAVGLIVLE